MITFMEFIAGTAGAFAAAAVASSSLGYNVVKDHRSNAFQLDVATGTAGANSWPERWPENWMEKAASEHVDGVWWTHKPDWPARQQVQKLKESLVSMTQEDAAQDAETEAEIPHEISSFFPFRVQWDRMKLDLEFADKRLAGEAAQLQAQLSAFGLKFQKAHSRYTEELSRAAPINNDVRDLRDGEFATSSDPDLMKSIQKNWKDLRETLEAEKAAIYAKYSAEAVSYNLGSRKALEVHPVLFWMRNVRIVQLDRLSGQVVPTRNKSTVNARLTVTGGSVSDREMGWVDIEQWSEAQGVGFLRKSAIRWTPAICLNQFHELQGSWSAEGATRRTGTHRLAAVQDAHQQWRFPRSRCRPANSSRSIEIESAAG